MIFDSFQKHIINTAHILAYFYLIHLILTIYILIQSTSKKWLYIGYITPYIISGGYESTWDVIYDFLVWVPIVSILFLIKSAIDAIMIISDDSFKYIKQQKYHIDWILLILSCGLYFIFNTIIHVFYEPVGDRKVIICYFTTFCWFYIILKEFDEEKFPFFILSIPRASRRILCTQLTMYLILWMNHYPSIELMVSFVLLPLCNDKNAPKV